MGKLYILRPRTCDRCSYLEEQLDQFEDEGGYCIECSRELANIEYWREPEVNTER